MAKPKANEESGGIAEWILTYSDTVTLLLCFFVLLYSFSIVNEEKWKQLVQSVSDMQGNPVNQTTLSPDSTPIALLTPKPTNSPVPTATESQEFDFLYEHLKGYIQDNNLEASIDLDKNGSYITIRFKDAVLFDPDSAVLRNDGKAILLNICDALKTADKKVEMMRIEGHTAARAAGEPQFQHTFEMSTERAVNVLRYMMHTGGLPAEKLSAVGYGQYHPIADNETEAGRIKNRRVEIIVSKVIEDSTAPTPSASVITLSPQDNN